jgi:hypothetical protein
MPRRLLRGRCLRGDDAAAAFNGTISSAFLGYEPTDKFGKIREGSIEFVALSVAHPWIERLPHAPSAQCS